MKTCNRCDVIKPLEEFYKHPKMADGYLGCCKDCHRAAVRVRYLDKLTDENWREGELYRHRVKSQRYRSEGRVNTEIVSKSRKAWDERNKEKKMAHRAVRKATRDGNLIRQPCEVCGTTNGVQAHHDDYSKPLDVRWLCVRHHADRHLELNRIRRAEKYRQAPNPAPER